MTSTTNSLARWVRAAIAGAVAVLASAAGVSAQPGGGGGSGGGAGGGGLNEPVIDLEAAAARPRPGQVQPGAGGVRAQRPEAPAAPAGEADQPPPVPAQARAGLAQVESLSGEFSRAQWRPAGTEGVWFELAPGQVFGETIELRLSAGTTVALRLSRGEKVVFHRMSRATLARQGDGRMLVSLVRGKVSAGDTGRLGAVIVGTPDRQIVLDRPGSVGFDAAEGVQSKP